MIGVLHEKHEQIQGLALVAAVPRALRLHIHIPFILLRLFHLYPAFLPVIGEIDCFSITFKRFNVRKVCI